MGVQFAGNILVQSNGGPLPISAGGTGQTTAPTALNALLPVQTGQAGKVLATDGTNATWSASAGGAPGGSDTYIQYNDSGTFGGSSFLTVNKSTGAVTSTSTLTNTGLTITWPETTYRTLKFQTAGSDRWLLQANNTPETGSAEGSDFEFVRVADNGLTQNQVFTVARASGVVDFKVAPTINGVALTSSAGSLTGTTLAANVVSSSLTSVGTITSGTWSGAFGSVSGANLTSLNAGNISSGTLLVARGGTGATTANDAFNNLAPSQVTNGGKFLTTDGTNTSWATVSAGDSLPSQTGNAGKYLTTNGTSASWATVATGAGNLPRLTTISSACVGSRVAVTTGQTITATTWAGGGSIAVGDVFSIYNDSGSAITITAGAGLTMYKDGTATAVGSVTLAARGSCTVWYNTVTEVLIGGSVT